MTRQVPDTPVAVAAAVSSLEAEAQPLAPWSPRRREIDAHIACLLAIPTQVGSAFRIGRPL